MQACKTEQLARDVQEDEPACFFDYGDNALGASFQLAERFGQVENLPHGGQRPFAEDQIMLRWAVIFLVIALIAGLFGFGGVAAISWEGAKILFFVFIVLAVLAAIGGAWRRPPI